MFSKAVAFLLSTAPLGLLADFPTMVWFESCPRNVQRADRPSPENLDKYLGIWYDSAHSKNSFQTSAFHCPTAEYSKPYNYPEEVKVTNCQINNRNGNADCLDGKAVWIKDGAFRVSFGGASEFFANLGGGANYNVVETDDEMAEYAIVYGCSGFGIGHLPFLWVLTRENNVPAEKLEAWKERGLELYKEFGASNGALKTMRRNFLTNDAVSNCDKNPSLLRNGD